MLELIRTLMLAGVGAIDLTEEKARSILDELVGRGELAEKEARELASTWARRTKDRREGLDRYIRDVVEGELARQNVATQANLQDVAERLVLLETKVERLQSAGAR